MGFGGEGLQVRDILHVDDLYDLVVQQLRGLKDNSGGLFNVVDGMTMPTTGFSSMATE